MKSQRNYEDLAKKVLGELEGVVTRKLRELKDELAELREGFRTLKPKQTISGCKTWDEFCINKLHRTKRAVNMLLVDDRSKGNWEETSQRDADGEPNTQESDEGVEGSDQTEELLAEASRALYDYIEHRWLSDRNVKKENVIQEVLDEGFPMEGYVVSKAIPSRQFVATDADLPSFEREVVNA